MRNVRIDLPFGGLVVYRAASGAPRPRVAEIREVPQEITDDQVEELAWRVVEDRHGLLLRDQGSALPGLNWRELVEQAQLLGITVPGE